MHGNASKVETFCERLRSGFHGADVTGVCQFVVRGATAASFYVEVSDNAIRYERGEHAEPKTTITMPETLFTAIIARPHIWDLHHPEVMTNVSVAGDVDLAFFLGNIARTPPRMGIDAFEEAERRARDNGLAACDIERLSGPTQREVVDRLDRGLPVLVTDCLHRSGAWTWEFQRIRNTFADLRLEFLDEETGAPTTLGQFFDNVEAGRQSYTHAIPLPPGMRPYFRIPLFTRDVLSTPMLWMGKRNGVSGEEPCTSLHRDTTHGFLGQVRGVKAVVLCSPDQAEKVYPVHAYNSFQSCQIQARKPDYERFPLSRGLRTIELILRPGELLVIPVGWFHEMYCAEPVMSISMFMDWRYWESLSSSVSATSARTSCVDNPHT
jgi:hypothetical protein